MQAIITKYLPCTDTKPSRIKAAASGGLFVTASYQHELNTDDAHRAVALHMMKKHGWDDRHDIVGGGLKGGDMVWVMVPKVRPLADAINTLIDHALEPHPHFESPRGQVDISAAREVVNTLLGMVKP